jgi:hypothetical protein
MPRVGIRALFFQGTGAASTGMATSSSRGEGLQETNLRCAAHHAEVCGISIPVLGINLNS